MARDSELPGGWNKLVSSILSKNGVTVTANTVSKIYGGFAKNHQHTVKVLEVIKKVKEDYKKAKEEQETLRQSILSA